MFFVHQFNFQAGLDESAALIPGLCTGLKSTIDNLVDNAKTTGKKKVHDKNFGTIVLSFNSKTVTNNFKSK